MRAGAPALDKVAAAAGSTIPEVRVRSVDILRRHSMGGDASLSSDAQVRLDGMSSSPDMGVARAALAALATNARQRAAEKAAQVDPRTIFRAGGGMVFVRPPIVARAAVARRVVVGRSVSVTVTNGKRTIVAQDGDQRVEISDGGDDGIKMTISKKVDGKEEKESFAAKDAEELKEKHADAYKEYAKYAKDGGGAVIRRSIVDILDKKALDGEKGAKKADKSKPKVPRAAAAPALVPPPKLPPLNHIDVPQARPLRQR